MRIATLSSWLAVIALVVVGASTGSLRAGTEDLSGQGRAEAAGRELLGSVAPGLVLKTIDGKAIDLGKLYGKKAIYLKFWATWCVPCLEQMPHFERTYRAAGEDLAVIAVDIGFSDSLEDVLDTQRTVVIDDSNGQIVHRIEGFDPQLSTKLHGVR